MRLNCRKNVFSVYLYIEKVEFETKEVAGVDDKVDVSYKIKEQPSGNFNAGISYGDFQGLSFQIGVEQQNFFGTGNSAGDQLKY